MIVKTMPNKIDTDENNGDSEEVSKEVLVIAQEIQIVKSLASNDVNNRNRQLKRLQKWLQLRVKSSFPFSEEDFRRIWKGLYYTMWMSDKPLVQEELAEKLGKLLLCFDGNIKAGADFFGAFLYTMCLQWFGIDQWRIDKFMMLVRRMLRYMLRVLKDAGWSAEGVNLFNKHLSQTVFADKIGAAGLTMHFLDIFCEELAKVAGGNITAEEVGQFVRPFVVFYCTNKDCKLTSHCRTRIFYHLLYQSAIGREYMDKYNAWKEMGFPTSSINDLEKADEEDAEENVQVDSESISENQFQLDPRAGNVDVFMPELPLDAKYVIDILEPYIYKSECNTKRRKLFRKLLEILKTYQNGEFPLGIKKMPVLRQEPKEEVIAEKMGQLDDIESELYGVGRKLKQLNKRKRRKLLKSLNFDDIDEDNFDKAIEKSFPTVSLKQRKRKAKNQLMNGWIEEEINEEELAPKKKKIMKVSNEKSTHSQSISQKSTNVQSKGKSIPELTLNGILEKKKVDSKKDVQDKIKRQKDQTTPTSAKTKSPLSTEIPKKAKTSAPQQTQVSEWDSPMQDGEMEYFIPSRKLKMKKANSELVINPLAMKKKLAALAKGTPTPKTVTSVSASNSPKTPNAVKRVKIALKHNTAQNPSEYIRQVKCSPDVPYDANRKPGKGLLKPHSMPSPINPFYKKKIGLRLLNDTM